MGNSTHFIASTKAFRFLYSPLLCKGDTTTLRYIGIPKPISVDTCNERMTPVRLTTSWSKVAHSVVYQWCRYPTIFLVFSQRVVVSFSRWRLSSMYHVVHFHCRVKTKLACFKLYTLILQQSGNFRILKSVEQTLVFPFGMRINAYVKFG